MSTGCAGEKVRQFLWRSCPQNNAQACFACLWKKGAAPHHAAVLSPWTERAVATPTATLNPAAGDSADRLRPGTGLSYPSRVCSTMGDAMDRIVEAIDQLANDAQGETSGRELATRVADLWLMISALDPELARRRQGYTTPADGAPSA